MRHYMEGSVGPHCVGQRLEIKGILGTDIIQETTEKIKIIKEKIKVAQSRQESYDDNRRRPLEFEEDDLVFLRV